MKRKGAIELSVSTIVVLVIGMTMLILGIVLVRTIFTGATKSVEKIDEGVKNEINKLFTDRDQKVVVNLPSGQVDINQGDDFGVAFGIRNTDTNTDQGSVFNYNVKAVEVGSGCTGLTIAQGTSYIQLGRQGTLRLNPGEKDYRLIKLAVPSTAPLCDISYQIDVDRGGTAYGSEQFFVTIVAA